MLKKRYLLQIVIKDKDVNAYKTKMSRIIEEKYAFKVFAINYLKRQITPELASEIDSAIIIDNVTGKVVYEHPLV